ncbi:putative chemoreceptor glutamine deamidase CheD 1 [Leptospira kobayashii]|uniref:Probable chemoreceptor glutamine deamidase CheD n=1 Tax=Leptospira kobayashii TaxID=1917830 RepID=A0ABM7UJK7_9LEPT|nr:chemotaxis protein CheD [Leptospira kobayashii]BDA79015.1 putative chemoreceptor glutamine deamidase CheD 1 [Leptospira kobayashii]
MMDSPNEVRDIFLNPGDFYFGGPDLRLRTLLGSCVSIVLWHPKKKIGGMSHYILPGRNNSANMQILEGKYGEEAFLLFLKEIKLTKLPISEFKAKIFGGSDMFSREEEDLKLESNFTNAKLVGQKNINFAKQILSDHSISVISENTGGSKARKIFFTVWDGEVWLETPETTK